MTRVLIYGGRNWQARQLSFDLLDTLHATHRFTVVISGCAPGADTIGELWAQARGLVIQEYPAAWARYGRAAGPIRNQQMLDEGRPEMAVGFPGGPGTADMTTRLLSAGVRPLLARYSADGERLEACDA